MFKRVLIAEDHESASISVRKTLMDLGIPNPEYTYYCDDALMLISKSLHNELPFDLLITDLSFEEDHRKQKIANGTDLIEAVRSIHPSIKVVVFSAENKAGLIEDLYKTLKIDAFIRKARHDAKELRLALEMISQNKTYLPATIKQTIDLKNTYEFTEFDITIISLLSKGMLQKDIPIYLQQHGIKPSGLSSIEKRLNLIKEILDFSKNEQLVAYCKDFGII